MRLSQTSEAVFLLPDRKLAGLLSAIRDRGYRLIGPAVRDAAVTLVEIEGVDDLPTGVIDVQGPGSYRIKMDSSPERFAFSNGPSSIKRYLFPPRLSLWRANGGSKRLHFEEDQEAAPCYAFVGIRPCDLQAVAVQDRVFLESAYPDTSYRKLREGALFVAVNCLHPSANCFCSSMGSGPSAQGGYDILLTEQISDESLYYLAQPASREGIEILDTLYLTPAPLELLEKADTELAAAKESISRQLEPERVAAILKQRLESPRWDAIEEQCLACANCTLVCPTCFCATVEDQTNLAGDCAERSRVWDSCFQQSFSYVAGGSIRASIKGRYRQWLTHKLSSWPDQFDTLGCVGCGRCITWCPVGIDIVEEANALCAESNIENSQKEGVSP